MSKVETFTLVERLKQLKDVFDAHVDFDEQGEVIAIGIFSSGQRHPKEIKRDVEEVFRSQMGYRVNHTKISIVEEVREEMNSDLPRVKFLTAFQILHSADMIEGVVQLQCEDNIIEGRVKALEYEKDLEHLIAQATAEALMNLIPDLRIRVNYVKETELGSQQIICVLLTCTHRDRRDDGVFVGACIKSKDLLTSVAKATLDALNRKLLKL